MFPSLKILSENDDDDDDDDDAAAAAADAAADDDFHDDDPHHPHSFLRCFKLKNARINAPEQPYDGKVSELTVAEFPEKFGEGPREDNRSSKRHNWVEIFQLVTIYIYIYIYANKYVYVYIYIYIL